MARLLLEQCGSNFAFLCTVYLEYWNFIKPEITVSFNKLSLIWAVMKVSKTYATAKAERS